jgi:hypothetical protein
VLATLQILLRYGVTSLAKFERTFIAVCVFRRLGIT